MQIWLNIYEFLAISCLVHFTPFVLPCRFANCNFSSVQCTVARRRLLLWTDAILNALVFWPLDHTTSTNFVQISIKYTFLKTEALLYVKYLASAKLIKAPPVNSAFVTKMRQSVKQTSAAYGQFPISVVQTSVEAELFTLVVNRWVTKGIHLRMIDCIIPTKVWRHIVCIWPVRKQRGSLGGLS